MATDLTNSIVENIGKASNCLILLPPNPSGDMVASGLALRGFLRKIDKEVVLLSPGNIDQKYSFLEGFDQINSELTVTKNFIIEVSMKKTAVDELSYKKEQDRLLISLKPKAGEIQSSDITFNTANFPFDLIVTIGVLNFDQLGDFYSNNAELFFHVPIVNIDYRSQNELFGQFNLIQITCNSTSEVIMDLINRYEANMIDGTIATALLTGIISETNSFQHTRTTPQIFIKASELVNSGANQQEIITQLFKSKSLSFLKLWGRALARLTQDNVLGIAHTSINQSDLEKSEAAESEIEKILPEMAQQLRGVKILLLLVEQSTTETRVYCQLPLTLNPSMIFGGFQPKIIGPHMVRFTLDKPIGEAQAQILDLLKNEANKLAA